MQTNESKVEEYMNTLSLLQRDKEEVSNVIRGYMLDCQMKDNEIEVLNKKITALETLIAECTDCGELDSRLFNAYMEHAINNT